MTHGASSSVGMLIKAADDKQPELDALEALRTRPDVDAETKAQIDREVKNIRRRRTERARRRL